jgi:predicted RNase H-like nuclease
MVPQWGDGGMVNAVGVDGIRGGWLSASWNGSKLQFPLWRSIRELHRELCPSLIAIDVPIGLPEQWETGGREVERIARERIGSRNRSLKSSVFPTAPREIAERFKGGLSFEKLNEFSKKSLERVFQSSIFLSYRRSLRLTILSQRNKMCALSKSIQSFVLQ